MNIFTSNDILIIFVGLVCISLGFYYGYVFGKNSTNVGQKYDKMKKTADAPPPTAKPNHPTDSDVAAPPIKHNTPKNTNAPTNPGKNNLIIPVHINATTTAIITPGISWTKPFLLLKKFFILSSPFFSNISARKSRILNLPLISFTKDEEYSSGIKNYWSCVFYDQSKAAQ